MRFAFQRISVRREFRVPMVSLAGGTIKGESATIGDGAQCIIRRPGRVWCPRAVAWVAIARVFARRPPESTVCTSLQNCFAIVHKTLAGNLRPFELLNGLGIDRYHANPTCLFPLLSSVPVFAIYFATDPCNTFRDFFPGPWRLVRQTDRTKRYLQCATMYPAR